MSWPRLAQRPRARPATLAVLLLGVAPLFGCSLVRVAPDPSSWRGEVVVDVLDWQPLRLADKRVVAKQKPDRVAAADSTFCVVDSRRRFRRIAIGDVVRCYWQ